MLLLTVVLFTLSACQKEGEGGTATISGKVYAMNYNQDGQLIGEYYAPDEDVYIVYGSGSSLHDDDYKTGYDGAYRFQYLTTGNYRIYVYSDCDTCLSGTSVQMQDVVISSNGDDIVLDDFVIRR